MKKLLIFMLVLGMSSLAGATVVYEFRAADGLAAISDVDVTVSTDFTLAMVGLVSDQKYEIAVMDQHDWYDKGGLVDFTGATVKTAAGNLGNATPFGDGYICTADDLDDGIPGNNPADGDWITFNLSVLGGADSGTFTFDLVDLGTLEAVGSGSINIIPEPMTIALLGLGGLFLLRRRK